MRIATLVLLLIASGCGAAKAIKQEPFPALQIRAAAPEGRAVLTDGAIQIKEQVRFATGKADIDPQSFELLDEVAQIMITNPDIELVTVEGHTDNVGNRRTNKRLSKSRAESVRTYLIEKAGIAAERIEAKGYGPDKPIADNGTPEGREQNRRVEFHIERRGAKAADDGSTP